MDSAVISSPVNGLFVELVQVSMGIKPIMSRMPTMTEWDEMFVLAMSNYVEGICFQGVVRLAEMNGGGCRQIGIDQDTFHRWATKTYRIVDRNKVIADQCVSVRRKLGEAGFATAILKGQGLMPFYGNMAQFRRPGDIDVWVADTAESVMEYAMRLTPTREFDWKHTHLAVLRGTSVELHWLPSVAVNPRLDRRYRLYYAVQASRQCRRDNADGGGEAKIAAPDAVFNSVYLLAHLYSHFVYDKMNVRQLMDYYQVLTTSEVQQNRDAIARQLKRLGLYRFAGLVMAVTALLFGVVEDKMLCPPDKHIPREVIDDLFAGGNESPQTKRSDMATAVRRGMRMLRYDKYGFLCMPLRKLCLAMWRRRMIRKYGL